MNNNQSDLRTNILIHANICKCLKLSLPKKTFYKVEILNVFNSSSTTGTLVFKEKHTFERFFCLFQLDFSHLLFESRSCLQIHNFLGFPDSILNPFPLLQVPALALGIVDVRGVGLRGETLGGEVDEAKLVSD